MTTESPARMDPNELLRLYLAVFIPYQIGKERLAYGATTLFVAGAAFLLIHTPPFWSSYPRPMLAAFLLLLLFSTLGTTLFVHGQLVNREFAIDVVQACVNLSTSWLSTPPTPKDLESVNIANQGIPSVRHPVHLWPGALWNEYRNVTLVPSGITIYFDYVVYSAIILWGLAALIRIFSTAHP